MKQQKIFGLHPTTMIDEFFSMVQPVTTMLYKQKIQGNFYSYKLNEKNIKKIYLPRPGAGKWGNERVMTIVDYIWYSVLATMMLPYLLTYKKILIHAPPFLQAHLVPIFRIFGKEVYVVVIDEQLPVYKINVLKKIYYGFAGFLEYVTVKFSTKTFVTSRYLYDKYKKFKEEVLYTPNGADVDTISAIKPKRKFKEFTMTYLGGFEKWRGIDLLINAFLEIKRKNNGRMKLLLIGNGPDFEEIKNAANNDPDIVFTGFMPHDESIAYCKGSDILVMPSRNVFASRTISSIKCFEYVACGVPAIVTDSGEHAYWTKKFGTGLVVKDTVDGIAEGILKLYKDKKSYDKIKKQCIKHKADVDYRKFKQPFVEEVLKNE